jgi:hypothetical protein
MARGEEVAPRLRTMRFTGARALIHARHAADLEVAIARRAAEREGYF